MPDKDTSFNIIQTKLFRPSIVSDHVPRPRLFKRLEKGSNCLLTLVSAPAGYGKSLLVSSWLGENERLSSWLSLDEEINDLNIFLLYFIAAIRKLFPTACENTFSLIKTTISHSFEVLSGELINELSEIKTPFILVLDDYGFIHASEIHELLNYLLKHLPQNLQLVLLTRRDPPLSLASLKGRGEIVNIRQADLKFTIQETSKFLHNEKIYSLDDESLTNIFEVTEGWPAGLRLLGLSMGQETDTKEFLRTMHGDTRDIREYLMDEVLSRQSSETREYLLKTSILNRLCPSLCDALCGKEHRGEAFIQQLLNSNLFCISLDEQHTWVRYHHLFQNLLQVHLERRYNRYEIKDLHKKASVWFEEHRYLEEALKYALKTDSPDEASEVIIRHRQEMTDREQWYHLVKMLDLLPQEVVEHNPDLLILYARTLDKRGQYAEWEQVLNRAEVSLNSLSDRGSTYQRRLGEILLMRSTLYYHQAQGQNAIDATEKALKLLPLESNSERVYAKMINAASCQMIGDQKRAYENIHDALQREAKKSPTYHGRLLQALSFMHWVGGDMHSLKQSATAMLELCRTHNIPETKIYAQYFLGASLYQLNELDEIEHILTPVATNQYGPSFYMYMMSVQALSLTHDCLGRQDQALELSDSLINTILKGEGASLLSDAQALRVELALRLGLLSQAVHWAKEIKRENAPPTYYFMIPELTIAKIYLSQATDDLLKQAEDLLDHLQDYFTSVHNTRHLVEVLSLKALLHDLLGNTMKAEEKLAEALNLAEPGGLIRIFVDLGSPMANILTRLTEHKTASVFAQKLLIEFEKYKCRIDTKKNSAPQVLSLEQEGGGIIRLTNRENDILELLSQRMSDKEIAAHLLISYGTVKRHAANIYRKLDVKGRRQAVIKATELGIIPQN